MHLVIRLFIHHSFSFVRLATSTPPSFTPGGVLVHVLLIESRTPILARRDCPGGIAHHLALKRSASSCSVQVAVSETSSLRDNDDSWLEEPDPSLKSTRAFFLGILEIGRYFKVIIILFLCGKMLSPDGLTYGEFCFVDVGQLVFNCCVFYLFG